MDVGVTVIVDVRGSRKGPSWMMAHNVSNGSELQFVVTHPDALVELGMLGLLPIHRGLVRKPYLI